MKRHGHLFEYVTAFANLFNAATRARQGCGWGRETSRFFFHLESELFALQDELMTGRYTPGTYRFFEVHDPKCRTIAVAPFRDRVVHHAVVQVLTPLYERMFIHDSYATRAGKGTHVAIRRAQGLMRAWPWYLKADVAKYFDNVDHDILIALLRRKIKDDRLLDLLEKIIRNASLLGIGLPVGNLTSQFLANVYLDPLDHELKDHWGVPGYVRYMDDWVLFGDDRKGLMACLPKVENFLETQLKLRLKTKATWLNRSSHGLSFLGMRVFPNFVRMQPRTRRKSLRCMNHRIREWMQGDISEEKMAHSLDSIVAHLRHFSPNVRIPVDYGKQNSVAGIQFLE